MKILFINPQSTNRDALPIPPLGVLYLSAYLREHGYMDVAVLDNNLYKYSIEKLQLYMHDYDLICVTGTTSQYREAVEISRIAKKCCKTSIYGGPHATALPLESMRESSFDLVVIGEGEETLLDVCNGLSLKDIPGIVYRDCQELIKTPKRKFLSDLDMLPLPARDLVPIHEYGNRELKRFEGSYTHMMTSRGCGSACTFCSAPMMWGRARLVSATRVFNEMLSVYGSYGIKNIHFQDDNFTGSRERALRLCDLILSSGIEFKWSCQTRPTCVDTELLTKMKQAGCVQIEFGVESGDANILKMSKKGYTKEQIREGFRLAREAKIPTYGFFIVGLPGETLYTWAKSVWFSRQLKLSSCVWTVLVPFPGTQIYSNGSVKVLDNDYANWRYKSPIIRSGWLGPTALRVMRLVADRLTNGWRNRGTYK